ncbi:MAG: alpha/beta fold hydrolase [Chloroflexi bacterium]|nr:alpha/beta fold hydrolase [Chloroflexota bacterium]
MILAVLGVGLGAVGLAVALSFGAARAYTHPPRTRPTRTPADLGLAYEATRLCCADGVVVQAWYVPPRNRATIILVHGLRANRELMLDRAALLHAHGFGTLLLDLRAHGESQGGSCTVGYREVAEVQAAVEYLLGHPTHRPERIGILGESLGGSVALLAAGALPQIQAVVVDSTFSALDDLVAEAFESLVRLPIWLRPLVIAFGEWQAGIRTSQVRPIDAARQLAPRPLLVIHGGQDELFPAHHAERIFAAAQGPCELWLVPEAGHGTVFSLRPEEYGERVVEFYTRHLVGLSQD